MGIDINLIIDKKNLRDLQTSTDDLRKGLEKDPVLKQHFFNRDDAEIEILDLAEEIKKLQCEIDIFKVASNYHKIEIEADEFSYKLKNLENDRVLANNSIRNIEKSINIDPDISKDKILNLYKQAQIEIPQMVVKKIEDVLDFHSNLLNSRKNRLFNELKKNKDIVKELDSKISEYGKQMDESLDYLNTHGALG